MYQNIIQNGVKTFRNLYIFFCVYQEFNCHIILFKLKIAKSQSQGAEKIGGCETTQSAFVSLFCSFQGAEKQVGVKNTERGLVFPFPFSLPIS